MESETKIITDSHNSNEKAVCSVVKDVPLN